MTKKEIRAVLDRRISETRRSLSEGRVSEEWVTAQTAVINALVVDFGLTGPGYPSDPK